MLQLKIKNFILKDTLVKKIFLILFLGSSILLSNTLEQIKRKGVLRVGIAHHLPPFSSLVNGKYEGFTVNLSTEIAKRIFGDKDGKVELIPVGSRERISSLEENKVDMITDTSITESRKKVIDFSMPYLYADLAFMTTKKNKIAQIADLVGKKILVNNGTSVMKKIQAKNKYDLVLCNSTDECVDKLKKGEGDAYIASSVIVLGLVANDSELELGSNQYGKSGYVGMGVAKGNDELRNAIDNQIIQLSKDGFFKKIFKEELNRYYKGKADEKYFLLDDLYSILGGF